MAPTAAFHTDRLVFSATNTDKTDHERIKLLLAEPSTQISGFGGPALPMTDALAEKLAKAFTSSLVAVYICLPKSPEEPKVAGEAIGIMRLGDIPPGGAHHRHTSFGIMFTPNHIGKGYGTEAMNWLLEYAFRGFNLHKVCGNTSAGNLPARKMYQKLGFEEEGVLKEHRWEGGEWGDEICLGLLASDWWKRKNLEKSV